MRLKPLESFLKKAPFPLHDFSKNTYSDAYNGYVKIPLGLENIFSKISSKINSEEITFEQIIENDYVVGFDTLHLSDTPKTCNEDIVKRRTLIFKSEIEYLINTYLNFSSEGVNLQIKYFGKLFDFTFEKHIAVIHNVSENLIMDNYDLFEGRYYEIIYPSYLINTNDEGKDLLHIKSFYEEHKRVDSDNKELYYYAEIESVTKEKFDDIIEKQNLTI